MTPTAPTLVLALPDPLTLLADLAAGKLFPAVLTLVPWTPAPAPAGTF